MNSKELQNYRNDQQDENVKDLKASVKEISDNQSQMCSHMSGLKSDIAWLKRGFWIITTSVVGVFITNMIQISQAMG